MIVPVLPRISNHTDFDPLRLHPQVDLQFIGPGQPIPAADLIILPGSKSVRGDLAQLRERGWDKAIERHLRYGGKLIGICGGLQMLGRDVHDPLGLEGAAGSSPGLGLLDYATVLEAEKQLRNVAGTLNLEAAPVGGYEIHAGVTTGPALEQPAVQLADGRCDGAVSADGRSSPPTCTACSRAASRVLRCCAGLAWKMCRASITKPCANATSSAWPTWWKSTWTPLTCANCAGWPDMRSLILGGARSGKSRLAEQLASASGLPVTYIATSQPLDGEMNERVSLHRQRRPADWGLIEEPLALAAVLRAEAAEGRCLLVDCLTLWLTNLLMLEDDQRLAEERDALLACLEQLPGTVILVSNETGLGVVPMGELTRRYVDLAGWLHQAVAERCQRVVLTVAGLPLMLKGAAL